MLAGAAMRELYYGDNLEVLRRFVPDESVQLVYLDPPFNSRRAYNLLFRGAGGASSPAKVTAFADLWSWDEQAEREFGEILAAGGAPARLLTALRTVLGEGPLLAYLAMMALRLLEIRRVMKDTASLYLHCDPSASHYLKVVLDAVFGARNFRNEIVWHYYNKYSAGKRSFGKSYDQILFYTRSERYAFQPVREARERPVRQLLRENVGGVLKNRKGPDGRVMYREVSDRKIDAVWRIPCLQPASREMLGYPTQKPLALLERIVAASSRPDDVVLDPFCGCGSAVHAAERLGRRWIGIDLTHLAIGIVADRLQQHFPGIPLAVHGVPKDLDGARALARRDKFEFQHWACWLVGAQSRAVKRGPDRGVDGVLYFQDDDTGPKKAVVSVQGGSSVHPAMVRELAAVMAREEATMGFFVTLTEPTPGMRREAQALGLYRPSPAARAVPRVQLLTVAGLLAGRERPLLPGLPPGEEDAPPPPAAGNGRSSRGKAGAGAGRGGAGAGLAGG